jgi:hypothetical protein
MRGLTICQQEVSEGYRKSGSGVGGEYTVYSRSAGATDDTYTVEVDEGTEGVIRWEEDTEGAMDSEETK